MKAFRISLLVLLPAATLLGWWLWKPTPDFVNYPPSADGPWVAFGDSLTEGRGAGRGKDYPAVLSRRLEIPIRNLGRSGETSADGLRRLDDVLRLRPRVVLLCYGGNDALQQVPVEQTLANLREIIQRLHAAGSFVVLVGIRSASLMDRNDGHFERLARETRSLHVEDFLQGIAFKPIYMSDAVHPNDEGYRIFAERLAGVLAPHMATLRTIAPPR